MGLNGYLLPTAALFEMFDVTRGPVLELHRRFLSLEQK